MLKFENPFSHCPVGEHNHFPAEKPRYTMTEEVEHTARQMKETIDRLLRFEERTKKDFSDLMHTMTADNTLFKSTLRESWATFLQEVKNEVNLFESQVDSTLSLFQKDVESNYATLSEDTKNQISENLTVFTAKLDSFETAYVEAFETLRTSLNAKLDNYDTANREDVAELTLHLNAKIDGFIAEINTGFTNFRNEISESVNEIDRYLHLNLAEGIEAKVNEMYANGELASIIEKEVFTDLSAKIDNVTTFINVKKYGAVGDGVTDSTTAFKNAVADCNANKLPLCVPAGEYILSDSVNASNISIFGENGTILKFVNTTGNGLTVGGTDINNLTIYMGDGFTGDLLTINENGDNYPDTTIVSNIRLYSQNNSYTGTFCKIIPSGNYGGIVEKLTIGRVKDGNTTTMKAENGILISIPDWATGYTFRDIIIDGNILKPLQVDSPSFEQCVNFIFDNVQIQCKQDFNHSFISKFTGCQDLYLTNCKIWDSREDITNAIYKNCTNVVIRNSPTFDKYFRAVNPFRIEGNSAGLEENLKLYNSAISVDGGYTGHSESLKITGDKTQAVPYLIPFKYEDVLYSKGIFEIWSRLDYGNTSGDNFTRVEIMQTNYLNNVVFMNFVKSYPTIAKIKKYKEGVVIWFKGGIDVNFNYISSGKIVNAENMIVTDWSDTTETLTSAVWDDSSVIPVSASAKIINTSVIDSTTTI